MYKLILMVDMNLEKTIFIIRNKLRFLTVEEVVFKCFDSNYLIARMAILELINRNPTNINLDDSIIRQVINKMTIGVLQVVKVILSYFYLLMKD